MVTGCSWFGKPVKCDKTCAPGYELISQNSHPGGSKSGCQTGHFSSFCCRRIETNGLTMKACPASNLGNALSNGLSPRFANVQDLFNKVPYAISDAVELGTAEECAYEEGKITVGEGAIGSIGRLGGICAIPNGVIPNFLPGAWVYDTGGSYTLRPVVNQPYPKPTTVLSCSSSTTETATVRTWTSTKTATCDGGKYPQACQHYCSVISVYSASVLSCAYPPLSRRIPRPEVAAWNSDHVKDWISWIPTWGTLSRGIYSGINSYCERDEYPTAMFMQGTGGANAQAENGGAGQLWNPACPDRVSSSTGPVQGGNVVGGVCHCM